MLELLQPFAMSLLIGLVIGIERERRHREGHETMGVRSFAIIALIGTCLAMTESQVLLGAAALITGITIVAGYWRVTGAGLRQSEDETNVGLTTEVTAILVFVLGYMSYEHALVAGIVGLAAVTLLYSRSFLHDFARNVLRAGEIRAAITLAVFAFIVVPFLPDDALDPWEILNPRDLGTIIAVIGAIEFGGYAVERMAGPRLGSLATGFFGGLASSTAVFMSLPKLVRENPDATRFHVGTGLMANAASLIVMAGILVMTSNPLAVSTGLPVVIAAIACAILGYVITRKESNAKRQTVERANPLDIKGALKLGLVIFGLLAVTAVVQKNLGSEAVGIVSFVSGLFELHGVTYANATIFESGQMSFSTASIALYFAVTGAFLSKCGIVCMGRSRNFATLMISMLVIAYTVGGLAAFGYWSLRG